MRAVKGAAGALLESSVDNKDEVAVVSFRGARAEIVLQPCRDAAAADERKLLKCENNPENASIHRTKGWSYYCRCSYLSKDSSRNTRNAGPFGRFGRVRLRTGRPLCGRLIRIDGGHSQAILMLDKQVLFLVGSACKGDRDSAPSIRNIAYNGAGGSCGKHFRLYEFINGRI
jgi:hypothetical protein